LLLLFSKEFEQFAAVLVGDIEIARDIKKPRAVGDGAASCR
jgi:hypothetical protein